GQRLIGGWLLGRKRVFGQRFVREATRLVLLGRFLTGLGDLLTTFLLCLVDVRFGLLDRLGSGLTTHRKETGSRSQGQRANQLKHLLFSNGGEMRAATPRPCSISREFGGNTLPGHARGEKQPACRGTLASSQRGNRPGLPPILAARPRPFAMS